MAEGLSPRKCPYCGCGFTPSEPDQTHCSVFCEQQEALEKGQRGAD